MRLALYLSLTTCLCALSSFDVHAQTAEKELGDLRGYSAPKMFSRSKPVATPQTQPAEVQSKTEEAALPSPASAPSPAPQAPVAQPVQPAPSLPAPAPVVPPAPAAQAAASASAVLPPPVAPAPAAAPPTQLPQIDAPVSAEQLLNFPATSQATPPVAAANSAAVPAAPVESGLPLPGSVPPSLKKAVTAKQEPKAETKKSASKKEDTKKPEPKKAAPAKPPVKEVAKPVPAKEIAKEKSKPTTKPPEIKAAVKAPEKPAAKAPLAIKSEPSVKKLPLPSPAKVEPLYLKPMAELPKPKEMKPYQLDGMKNMPSIKQGKIEKEKLTAKMPLPEIVSTTPTVAPTMNERMIDKALEDHIINPTPKAIEKQAAPLAPEKKSVKPEEMPEPVPAPSPSPKPTAPVAPTAATVKPALMSMEFKPSISELQPDQKKIIDTDVLPKLKADTAGRLQILSYAAPAKEGQSSARRLSLSRGLAIRQYLLDKGTQPNRIDIRALGDSTQEKPLDRVDFLFIPSK